MEFAKAFGEIAGSIAALMIGVAERTPAVRWPGAGGCGSGSAGEMQAARPRSLAIITRRRLPQRSASAPACTASRRFGARTRAVSTPIRAGVACRVSTPTTGNAVPLT